MEKGALVVVAAAVLVSGCWWSECAGAGVDMVLHEAGVAVADVAAQRLGEGYFALVRTIHDVEGTYTIPYVQSSRDLEISLRFSDPSVARGRVLIGHGKRLMAEEEATAPDFAVRVADLPYGEYTVEVLGLEAAGATVCRAVLGRVGIGIVAATIGDSITEGYFGHGFLQEDLELSGEDFPSEAVSRDGRNFPQYAPTAHVHLPNVNCFQSWMTELNDLLAETWRDPVFIANEGWGGITSGGYLDMMRDSENWRSRMRALRPSLWLIHLGVNDERAFVTADAFAANMAAIIDGLVKEFGASPERIFVAKPCYDYADGAAAILETYCAKLDALCAEKNVQAGPDFYAAYATDKERWYGADPVHPNVEGMSRMAALWHDTIVKRIPGRTP
ncbi:MAG TPA: SGNH/GDSL hydrolase family protein [Candidatus Hydrogenedentes bacterium]|nr:SGNH/GDSL hydrolase family protein [Candidatus Hydrogenedentota bacterium]HPG69685.1 SGNH/GDSL hydrolase family protein [Candidatus Hydrogenedentota bacterium]